MKTFTLKSALLLTSFCLSTTALALGTSVTGGEHSAGEMPIDLALNARDSLQPMDPVHDLPAYTSDIAPLIERYEKTIPELAHDLKSTLSKRWYFTSLPMSSCGGGSTMVQMTLTTRACQDSKLVVVDKNWILNDSIDANGQVVSAQLKQKTTILHEMFRNLSLKNHEIEEIDLQYIVRTILGYEGSSPSDQDLTRQLKKIGFGDYATSESWQNVYQAEAIMKKSANDCRESKSWRGQEGLCGGVLKFLNDWEYKNLPTLEMTDAQRNHFKAAVSKERNRATKVRDDARAQASNAIIGYMQGHMSIER